jgi:hypothetical protein
MPRRDLPEAIRPHRADVKWDVPSIGRRLILETRETSAQSWFASEESRDPGWQILPLRSARGRIVAMRPALPRLDAE